MMGQTCSLKIPKPDDHILDSMKRCGIDVHMTDEPYVSYDLPMGWKTVSFGEVVIKDLPNFHIVDNKNLIRFVIMWKQEILDNNPIVTENVTTPEESSEKEVEWHNCNDCGICMCGIQEGDLKFADKWYCKGLCCQKQVNILVERLNPCLLIELGYRDINIKVIQPKE